VAAPAPATSAAKGLVAVTPVVQGSPPRAGAGWLRRVVPQARPTVS
jgi:hypothetical protein